MARRMVSAPLLLAAGVVLGACGSGSQPSAASGTPSPTISSSPVPSSSTSPAATTRAAKTPSATTLDGIAAAAIPLGFVSRPLDVVSAFGSIWTANHGSNDVSRIDGATLAKGPAIESGDGPGWFAVTDGALWVTNQNGIGITRIDPTTNAVVAVAGKDAPCGRPAVARSSLWYLACDAKVMLRIDPRTNAVIGRVPAEGYAGLITIDDNVFAVGPHGLASLNAKGDGFVTIGGCCGFPIGYDGTTVWLADDTQVVRVDPKAGKVVATLPIAGSNGLAVRGTSAWLTASDGRLLEVDLHSNEILRTVKVGGKPLQVIDADGALWVTDYYLGRLWRLTP